MVSTRQKRLRKRRPPPTAEAAPAKPPPKPSSGTPASVIAHREKIAMSRAKNPGGPFYTPPKH